MRKCRFGRIKSIDQHVSDFYPEWKQGQKALITRMDRFLSEELLRHPGVTDTPWNEDGGFDPQVILTACPVG